MATLSRRLLAQAVASPHETTLIGEWDDVDAWRATHDAKQYRYFVVCESKEYLDEKTISEIVGAFTPEEDVGEKLPAARGKAVWILWPTGQFIEMKVSRRFFADLDKFARANGLAGLCCEFLEHRPSVEETLECRKTERAIICSTLEAVWEELHDRENLDSEDTLGLWPSDEQLEKARAVCIQALEQAKQDVASFDEDVAFVKRKRPRLE